MNPYSVYALGGYVVELAIASLLLASDVINIKDKVNATAHMPLPMHRVVLGLRVLVSCDQGDPMMLHCLSYTSPLLFHHLAAGKRSLQAIWLSNRALGSSLIFNTMPLSGGNTQQDVEMADAGD